MRDIASSWNQLSRENSVRTRYVDINYVPRVWEEEAVSDSEGAPFEKKSRLRYLQSRSRAINPTIWIGKEGASEKLLIHVKNQLRARELVKLKVQKAALVEEKTLTLATEVARSTDSTLVEVMGHTFSLYKKRDEAKITKEHPKLSR